MGWTTSDIPDLSGRTAVVTGGNAGLGYETVKALADHGASVIMASRNEDKAHSARQSILADNPDASVSVVSLDLASPGFTRLRARSCRCDYERHRQDRHTGEQRWTDGLASTSHRRRI